MNNRNVPSNGQALVSFVGRKAEIDALLSRIQGASADHFNTSPDDVHWGHAGTLGHVAEKLREIAAFLNV
jgi:hypothetical protein